MGMSGEEGRPVGERIVVRFPFLMSLGARALARLRPGSRLRQRTIATGFRTAWAAINRGDFELAVLAYERDADVFLFGADGVGLTDHYSGEQGWPEFIRDIFETFGQPRFTVRRVVDGGDRIVAEIGLTATGRASGAPVEQATASVYYLSPRGKITRQDVFWHDDRWQLALEAAGLSCQDALRMQGDT